MPSHSSPTVPDQALQLASALAAEQRLNIEAYTLTDARCSKVDARGKAGEVWYLTFKLSALLPDPDEQPIGAGGEWFVEVDLANARARLLGYGE